MKNIFTIILLVFVLNFIPVTVLSEEKGADEGIENNNDTHEHTKTHREKELEYLTTITITADPRNKSLLEYSNPASVMTKDELILKADTTLGETLSSQPGVSSSYFGPGSSRPVIRGNAGERVRVLKNGVGSLDVSNLSEDHQISINPLSIESAEVLRGPETLLYGSSAIGGVVNVTEGSIPSRHIEKPFTGEFNLRTQTVNNEATGALKLEGSVGKFNWHLSGLSQDTGDIDIPGFQESARLRAQEADEGDEHEQVKGVLQNSSTRTLTGTAGGSYVWDKGYVGLSLTGYDTKYGVPGHAHHGDEEHGHEEEHEREEHHEEGEDDHDEDSHGEEGVFIELEQYRVDTRGEVRDVNEKIEKIKFSGALSSYSHSEFEDGIKATNFKNDAFELRSELLHAPISDFSGTIGTQIEYSDLRVIGDEAFVPDSKRFAPGVFIFEELPFADDRLSAQFGGRVEHVHISPGDDFSSKSFTPVSLSTGLSWDITGRSDYVAGVSLAYAQRAPSATELYADGVHIARSIAEIGDQSLSNEDSFGLDITFKKNTGIVTGGMAFFAQEYGNYINLISTGRQVEGLREFVYDETRARFFGFETEATLHLHEALGWYQNHIDLSAQLDYVRAKDTKNNDDLPRITPLRSSVVAKYGWKELFSASVEGVFVAAQRDVAEGELPTDAYQLLNSTLELKVPYINNENMKLYARGQNLTDEEARVHTSFIKDMAPLAGRSFIFGLRGMF